MYNNYGYDRVPQQPTASSAEYESVEGNILKLIRAAGDNSETLRLLLPYAELKLLHMCLVRIEYCSY